MSLTSLPNLLSLSRIPLGIVLFACMSYQLWLVGLVVFLVATLTDWLDGWLARRWNQVSLIGRNLDPLTDKFLICGAFIYFIPITSAGILPWMVTLIVGREILITGLRGIVEATGKTFAADRWGKIKTGLQCAVIIGALLLLWLKQSEIARETWPTLDIVQMTLLYAMLLATIGSGLQYVVKAAKMLA